jgi:methylphosphotriester-DNA--protein-cysteine methyltransferase
MFLKTPTLNWLIPLKEVYNNRDSFPSLEHYTQQLHTNTKKAHYCNQAIFKRNPCTNYTKHKNTRSKTQASSKQLSIQTVAFDLGFDQPTYFTKYFKKDRTTLNNFKRLFPNLPLSLCFTILCNTIICTLVSVNY